MKIRMGFVSNSSSSSFTCNVCGEETSGMDMSLDDAEMKECINGHTFCDTHQTKELEPKTDAEMRAYLIKDYDLDKDEVKAMSEEDVEEEYSNAVAGSDDGRYEVSPQICPCCQFDHVADGDFIKYALKELGLKEEDLPALFKKKFKSYEDFEAQYDKKSKN